MEEVELELSIRSAGDSCTLAEFHAEPDHDPPCLGIGQTDARDGFDSFRSFARGSHRGLSDRIPILLWYIKVDHNLYDTNPLESIFLNRNHDSEKLTRRSINTWADPVSAIFWLFSVNISGFTRGFLLIATQYFLYHF